MSGTAIDPLLNSSQATVVPKVAVVEPVKSVAPEPFARSFDKAREAVEPPEDSRKVSKAKEESEVDERQDDTEEGNVLPIHEAVVEEVVLELDIALSGEGEFLAEDSDEAVLVAADFVLNTLNADLEEAPETEVDVALLAGGQEQRQQLLTRLETTLSKGAVKEIQNMDPEMIAAALVELEAQADHEGGGEEAADLKLNSPRLVQQSAAAKLSADLKPELAVQTRVGSAEWGEAMMGRISLLVNQKLSTARIHLNPAELGPVEVRVNLNHDQASVQFVSHSAQVRDALEQSIPRLREMLETAGFNLADSHVGDQSAGQQGGQQQQAGTGEGVAGFGEEETTRSENLGLIDHYV